MSEQQLREQLYASFRHRAMLYYLIFDELRAALDEQQAIAIMQRAIRRRGEQVGKQFAPFAPGDLAGLRNAFLAAIPDDGRMFSAQVQRCDDQQLDMTLQTCPLKDAWQVVLDCEPNPIRLHAPQLSQRLAAVIDRALVDKPEILYKSALELKAALKGAL